MPWLSVGWHRHLWERPVLDPKEVPSLVDENGRFKWGHRKNHLMKEATYEDALYGTNELQDHLKAINSPLWVGNMK